MVVYAPGDGAYAAVAEQIASDRGESVVSELDDAVASDEPVVYVEAPSRIAEQKLLALQERLVERGPKRGAFGVITGYTPETAADLYLSRSANNGEDALLHRNPPEGMPEPPNTNLLLGQEATAANVEAVTAEPLRSLQISASGRPIHVFLADGQICGIPETHDFADFPGKEPFCVEDGEFDCPLAGDLVHSQSIDVSHFFLMSCSSTIDNGTAGLPVNVTLGLLDGADSLVGTYRVGFNQPPELLLHHALLSAGYDVSERCYLLNQSAHANGIMLYPYVAFGRPDAGVADPYESSFDVEIDSEVETATDLRVGTESDLELGESVCVRLTDVDAYVADVRIPTEQLPDYDDRLYVRNRTETDHPVYYTVFEETGIEGDDIERDGVEEDDIDESGGARLLAYTGTRMRMDELELVVSPRRARHVERRTAVESAKNVRRTAELDFLSSDAADRVAQLDAQIRKLPVKTEWENFDADLHADLAQEFSILHGQVKAIREEILATTRARSDFLHFEYAGNAAADDVYLHDQTCCICGERPVWIKQVTGWSGDAKRLLSSCPRCAYVFDVPASERDADPEYPKVRCELDADGPRRQPVEIEFTNPTDDPMQATFQPLVLHRDNEEEDFFDPEEQNAVLLPGETHTAEFTVDAALLDHNMYYVMGVVVGNLDVYAGYDVPMQGDEGEYYPRHLR